MKKAKITNIDQNTYRFTEAAFGTDVYMYLLVGREKALLIDTGYGFTDVPAAIREITNLPLIVVNTHGHMDHMHGNHLYPEVHLSEQDDEVFARHNDSDALLALLKQIAAQNHIPEIMLKLPMLNVKGIIASYPSKKVPLPDCGYFELGDRKVSIIETPGHTQGSICLFDETYKMLFVGDTACHDGVLLNFPESTSVAVFKESILKLKKLTEKENIPAMYPGHQNTPQGTALLSTYLEACDILLCGEADPKAMDTGLLSHKELRIQFNKNNIGGIGK